MPPRRRKKSNQHRKRPLAFAESPVNIYHDIPSPIASAKNPPTADVVPFDDTKPWISPQFQQQYPGDVVRRRITRSRSRTARQANVNYTSLSISETAVQKNAKQKYSALKFLGETTEIDSPIIEISYYGQENENVNSADLEDGILTREKDNNDKDINKKFHASMDNTRTSSADRVQLATQEKSGLCCNKRTRLIDGSGVTDCKIDCTREITSCVMTTCHKDHPLSCDQLVNSPLSHLSENDQNRRTRAKRLFSSQRFVNSAQCRSSPRLVAERQFFNLLQQTPVAQFRDFKVLVEDTPDSEKGLSVLERRHLRVSKRAGWALKI